MTDHVLQLLIYVITFIWRQNIVFDDSDGAILRYCYFVLHFPYVCAQIEQGK